MTRAPFRFVVPSTGERLDRLVADATGQGRRHVREWFREGRVRVDGRTARGADLPATGSTVVVDLDVGGEAPPPPFRLHLLVEGRDLVVVSKPAGLHCERGRSPGSLADLLEARYGDRSGIGDREAEGGLVHRLDRDTSGVVVAARDRAAWTRLRRAFSQGFTRKQYLALAGGRLERTARSRQPLARRGERMTAATGRDDALEADTLFEPLETGSDWTLVRATMSTGVMHQVRVHLALLGHPIFGDTLYGGEELAGCARRGQLLHAFRIEIAGELDASAGPPADFVAAYARLRRTRD